MNHKTLSGIIQKYVIPIFVVILLIACNPERKPIQYGEDKCAFCRMSIVDQRFGGEIVTQKGKIYMFDAVECLVNYLDENVDNESALKLVLTNTIDDPGSLRDAEHCYYLKSRNMPSPMGMYLNPFSSRQKAVKSQEQHSGNIYTWQQLRAEFMTHR